MIARYTRPELAALWSEPRRLALSLEVELAATAALELAPASPIPAGTASRLRQLSAQLGPLDPSRVAEIERRTQHELLAFLEHVEERLGPEARWLHFGLTSSDILDSVLALQLREATQIIIRGIDEQLLPALRRQATAHQQTPMIGRTHGISAEPIAAGLVFLGSYTEIERAKARLQRAQKAIAVGKLAGAVGVYGSGSVTPEVEEVALASLGLAAETVPTQIVARDRHAELLWALALLGAAIERLAVNLRHLQRSEVSEVEEAFAPGQKGSSAMPHKKNPISAENLCGLARLLRANASAAVENISLWHERDISHSSVERVIMPDSTTLADYMVQRAARLVGGLHVRTEQMRHNLSHSGDLYASEKVMLQLVRTGLSRHSAYELVQRHALAYIADRGVASATFLQRLASDPQITERLPCEVLSTCFELSTQLAHVPAIFARTLQD